MSPTPDSFITFGTLLRFLRLRAGLAQRDLAQAVGYSEAYISRLEQNQRAPDPLAIQARFVPALGLEGEPQWVGRLAALATASQGRVSVGAERPASLAAAPAATRSTGNTGLLVTKLYQPRPRRRTISRPRLLSGLAHALDVPLALIAAPAGFGKTTLLADWLAQLTGSPDPRPTVTIPRVAWLSLDADDNDPVTFLRYLIATLQQVAPYAGESTLALLQAPQLPPLAALMPPLLNDLAGIPGEIVLVLDDYHVLTNATIHAAVAFLLDRLPPNIHLVLASRSDPPLPLARLRARGQLVEVRAGALRFTADEAAAFLREAMDVALTSAEAAALEERTEGWAAGLQLAALALRDRGDSAAFVQSFTGSNRFVVDYLVEEVLGRLPAHMRTFVVQTAILERMCGELCDALLGLRDDGVRGVSADQSYSQLILAELERLNLFLVPLDNARRWYRYHQLFREVLLHRLQHGASATEVGLLHRRASAWFEGQGLAGEAIQHAFAAPDPERAAYLVEDQIEPLQKRGEHLTLQRWLELLPREVIERRPRLCLALAINLILAHDLDEAERYTQRADALLQSGERQTELLGYLLLARARIAQRRNEFADALDLAQRALTFLPAPHLLRGQALMTLGVAAFWCDLDQQAIEAFEQASQAASAAGDMYYAVHSIINQAEMLADHGRLREAIQRLRAGLAIAQSHHLDQLPLLSKLHDQLGLLLCERNQLEPAAVELCRAIELVDRGTDPYNRMRSRARMARLLIAQGDHPGAQRMLDEAHQIARVHTLPYLSTVDAIAYQVLLWCSQGNLSAAREWASASGLGVDDELSTVQHPLHVAYAHVLVATHATGPAQALLTRLYDRATAIGRGAAQIELAVLLALDAQRDGRADDALAAIGIALSLAAPEGAVRTFIDEGPPMAALLMEARAHGLHPAFCAQLLAAFSTSSASEDRDPTPEPDSGPRLPAMPPSLVEPLTARELEVLVLLAQGCSNQQIATRLVITVGTVKRHLNNLFGKLAVESRLQLVARARELGLV